MCESGNYECTGARDVSTDKAVGRILAVGTHTRSHFHTIPTHRKRMHVRFCAIEITMSVGLILEKRCECANVFKKKIRIPCDIMDKKYMMSSGAAHNCEFIHFLFRHAKCQKHYSLLCHHICTSGWWSGLQTLSSFFYQTSSASLAICRHSSCASSPRCHLSLLLHAHPHSAMLHVLRACSSSLPICTCCTSSHSVCSIILVTTTIADSGTCQNKSAISCCTSSSSSTSLHSESSLFRERSGMLSSAGSTRHEFSVQEAEPLRQFLKLLKRIRKWT